MTKSSTVSSEQVVMDEYDRAVRAVAAAAAEYRRPMGKADDPIADIADALDTMIGDAVTIMRGVIRVRLEELNGDDTAKLARLGDDMAELACLNVVIRVLSRDCYAAPAFNTALEANGVPWRFVKPD